MNVARSTFMKGYLLTALSVAVLLAGFSGTAWAQTKSFTLSITRSAVLKEGASSSNSSEDRTTLTITRSDPTYVREYDDDGDPDTADKRVRRSVFGPSNKPTVTLTATCNGVASTAGDDCPFSVEVKEGDGDLNGLRSSGTDTVEFASSEAMVASLPTIERTIELLVSHTADDGDWNEETVVLTLGESTATGLDEENYSFSPARKPTSTLTIVDDDDPPKLKFAPPSIQLAKGNMQTMTVGVDISGTSIAKTGIRTKLNSFDGGADRDGSSDEILLSISPPGAVGSLIKVYRDAEPAQGGTDLETDRQGRYIVGTIGTDGVDPTTGAVATSEGMEDGIELTIEAIDVSGFRDEQITFTLMDGRTEAQKRGDGGAIQGANPATVTLLSGEETPTVTFSKASVSIDEGASETVHLLADSDQGDQVGSVTVSVSGDALIELRQNGSTTSGLVSFGGSANAELTIVSLSDPDLEDGEESMATVTITDAGGANIGDPRAVTVTVVGSTAVPVLPLFAQLLLALLLMVGGARLYRRRQG